MKRLLALLLSIAWASSGSAQDTAAVAAALDSLVPDAIARAHVPGAVVAIVRGDSVLALRGYGYARLEDSVRANPYRSTYRLASVAKLFVVSTVLQRVAAGQLGLDRDIREYVPGMALPPGRGTIMLQHLLTHTAGFDERVIGYGAPSRAAMRPLGEYLAARLPDRGWAAGEVVSYSNHGMALAAYIAEAQSHTPYSTLAAQTVFRPFGMTRTYYIDPPSDSVAADLAPGYRCGEGGCERAPVVWSNAYPVGVAFSTAADMSRFMRAWLNDGMLDGTRVLDTFTVRAAMRRQFTHDPRLPGMGFGWFEQQYRGVRLLAHGGGVAGTAALVVLAPELRLGLFVVTNAGEPTFTRQVMEGVFDRLLPADSRPAPAAHGSVAEYGGYWRLARYSHYTVEKFPGAFGFSSAVRIRGDTLLVPSGVRTRRFVRVDSLLLEEVADHTRLVLRRDDRSRLTHLFTGVNAGGAELPGALERVPWYEGNYFLNEYASYLVGLPPLVLLVWGLVAGGLWLWRRRRGVEWAPVPRSALVAIGLATVNAALLLWFMFGFVAAGTRDLSRGMGMGFGMTPKYLFLLRLAWVIALASIPILVYAIRSWRDRWWSLFGRICYSAVALGAVLATHFLVWWNYVPGRY